VTFAKTSRSPKPFDEIAAELTDEKSARFHEKWVVGYGHASVAEHAVLHLALENVSRMAIETIEGNRLASYTEKSSRYQQWDGDAFYVPDELHGHDLEKEFIQTCRELFSAYETCIPIVEDHFRKERPRQKGESEQAFERRLRTMTVDVCRFLLPAASLANVGVTINARALEYALCKMLSSPLAEVRAIGEKVKQVSQAETPTLIKYAGCQTYMLNTRSLLKEAAREISGGHSERDFALLSWEPAGELKILAALLFRFGRADFEQCLAYVQNLSEPEVTALMDDLMLARESFDQPLREFEYAQMTFEAVMDQGAYFEFKRHRMMTQTVQPLVPDLGFALPQAITASDCEETYLTAMRHAAHCFDQLKDWNPDAASYIVPNGFNRRVLFTLNLRQAFHICRLRAAANAHFSIRRVAQEMFDAISHVYPRLGRFLNVPHDESWQGITKKYFTSLAVD
jgi:thymidylate synthase ThyX